MNVSNTGFQLQPWQQRYFEVCAHKTIAGHQAYIRGPWRKNGKSELIGRLIDRAMRALITVELLLEEK